MLIRRAKLSDLPDICSIIRTSLQKNVGEDSAEDIAFVVSKEDIEHKRKHLITREMFVADQDGQILGTICLSGNRINSLYVDFKSMGAGIGRKLIEYVEQLAAERNISNLVVSSSRTAVPFYERLGYKKLNYEPREWAPTWAMLKSLNR